MISRILTFLLTVVLLQSCTTLNQTQKATGTVEDQNLMAFKTNYQNQIPQFDYLQIKSKIDVHINNKPQSATLRLYIDKDDMIWANVSLLGITGARAKITPANVQAYEILDKTFINDNFDYLNQKFKINFINYQRFQQLLLGQLFLVEPWESYVLNTTENNEYELAYKQNEALKKSPQENKFIHTFYLDSNYRLSKVEIEDSKSNSNIVVNYDKWQIVEGKNLPGKIDILIQSKDTDRVQLDYNNFDFEQMNPPFRIPENYKERKLK